jgi:predicted transcriptional regulator
MPEWNFLTNHALVLSYIAKHPLITARDVARSIGITERAVRKIISDLDNTGYIDKKKQGRGIKYSINTHLSLRHHTQWKVAIGDFLEALGWKQASKATKK